MTVLKPKRFKNRGGDGHRSFIRGNIEQVMQKAVVREKASIIIAPFV
jgi:hypothetical protein